MKSRTVLLGLFAFLFVWTSALPAQQSTPVKEQSLTPDKEKEADIVRLLEVTGARNIGNQMIAQMMQSMEKAAPNLVSGDEKARKFMSRFREEFVKEVEADDISIMVIPIYGRAFTHEEIRGLIQFYESPLGQKVIKTLPQIMQESMAMGQQWGQRIALRVFTRLSDEFPELKEVLKTMTPEKP